ncbi:uncharacterized protein LOC143463464 [Clavelina lepadiformis]
MDITSIAFDSRSLPCLWQSPDRDYIPLINYPNKDGNFKVYGSLELSWEDTSPSSGALETLMQHVRTCRATFENLKQNTFDSLAKLGKDNFSVPLHPKTPSAATKTKSRTRGIQKKKSVLQVPPRRSSRRQARSENNPRISMEVIDTLTSLGLVKQTKKQKKVDKISPSQPEEFSKETSKTVTNNTAVFEEHISQTSPHHSPKVRQLIEYHEHAVAEVTEATDKQPYRQTGGSGTHSKEEQLVDKKSTETDEKAVESSVMEVDANDSCNTLAIAVEQDEPEEMDEAATDGRASISQIINSANEERNSLKRKSECATSSSQISANISSVCSSSAATIDLDEFVSNQEIRSNPKEDTMEQSDFIFTLSDKSDKEDDEPVPATKTTSIPPKKSYSLRKSIKSTARCLDGLAAKRRSTRQSQRLKVMQNVSISSLNAENTTLCNNLTTTEKSATTDDDTESTISPIQEIGEDRDQRNKEGLKKYISKPKIIKPIVRPTIKRNIKKSTSIKSAGQLKRSRAHLGKDTSFHCENKAGGLSTPSPPKQKRPRNIVQVSKFLNRSTAASRARKTPGRASPVPTRSRFEFRMLQTPTSSNINNTVKSFLLRNTPEKINKENDALLKKKQMEEKRRKEEELQHKLEEEKQLRITEQKKKREERAKRAIEIRMAREKAEKERKDQLQDRWEQRIADADRNKNQRRVEENVKMLREMEKQSKAEAKRKEEEEEKLKRIEEQKNARREREVLRRQKKEEAKLARAEEKRKKEELKKLKEEERIREEQLKQEEQLVREREEAKRREDEEAKRKQEELEKKALEEKLRKKMEAAKKREDLRKKVEEERRLREGAAKQEAAKQEAAKAKLVPQEDAAYYKKIREAEERIKVLQQQSVLNTTHTNHGTPIRAVQNTTYTQDETLNNYDMTPRGPGRPLLPSTSEDYNIEDFRSDDSTDNEDEPKKVVPKWAKGAQLQSAIIKQYRFPPNIDHVFPNLLDPVNLSRIFQRYKERYFKRTSSAHWNSPVMPPGHISFTQQCKGFD